MCTLDVDQDHAPPRRAGRIQLPKAKILLYDSISLQSNRNGHHLGTRHFQPETEYKQLEGRQHRHRQV